MMESSKQKTQKLFYYKKIRKTARYYRPSTEKQEIKATSFTHILEHKRQVQVNTDPIQKYVISVCSKN